MNCLTCTHSHVSETDDGTEIIVQCRRYPPQIVILDGEIVQMFPNVTNEDVCGEWQAD